METTVLELQLEGEAEKGIHKQVPGFLVAFTNVNVNENVNVNVQLTQLEVFFI